jgi:hypothetical protein
VTALVVAEAVALGLLALLVLGLLRSHAEILRRLEALQGRAPAPATGGLPLQPGLPGPADRPGAPEAHDVAGETPFGDAVQIGLAPGGPNTLLAFLTSGCTLCRGFWEALQPERRGPNPAGARVVAVTRDPRTESPGKLRELAPPDLPVVMSGDAWASYGVPGAPYFVYVDGASGRVHGEGAATTWEGVESLLRDALLDSAPFAAAAPPAGRGAARQWRSDGEMASAGIGPEDPSLYPERDARGNGAG